MTDLEHRFMQYHKDIERTFLSAGGTPFMISKEVWRLHGEMEKWLAINAPREQDLYRALEKSSVVG